MTKKHNDTEETILVLDSLKKISADQWDQFVDNNPFLSYDFLVTLENNKCIGSDSGWSQFHIVQRKKSKITAIMPAYLKSHSYGEYVFDWAWADAYQRHGLNYYPKMVSAIPFTPVCGPRLLAKKHSDKQSLLSAALTIAKKYDISSIHYLFPDASENIVYEEANFLPRKTVQFHWSNNCFKDFEEFLSTMNHRKRKNIRQERRKLMEQGFEFERLTGTEVSEELWSFFYDCYQGTYIAHNSMPYLNRDFFLDLNQRMPEKLILILAKHDGKPVATALNLLGKNRLYGRYWGCLNYVPGLHFEVCYYQAIDYCILNGIGHFEGGAQGEHKLARGLTPHTTISHHWLAHPEFSTAVENFLSQESVHIERYVNELGERNPYKTKKST